MEFYITLNPDVIPFNKTLQQIKTELSTEYCYEVDNLSFIVCREYAKREHYHMYLRDKVQTCPPGKPGDPIRNKVRRYLRNVFEGEIRMSSKQVEDKIRAIAYTMKEGDYVTYKLDWNDFLKAKAITHPKKPKYQDALQTFYENVSGKSETKLVNEIIDIHDNYNVMIDPQRIAKMVRLSKVKQKDAEYRKRLVDRIIDEI